VEQLYADLIEMDRMLPACPGVIGIQTLAGALGTGTHGQGLRQSSLGDAALSMKVMLADGQIQLVERDDPRFGMPRDRLGGEFSNRAECHHEVP
jgi:FAD/FMN-containing dehydrogenase